MTTLEQLHPSPTEYQYEAIDQPPSGGIFLPETPIPPGYFEHAVIDLDNSKVRSIKARARLDELAINSSDLGKFQNTYLKLQKTQGGCSGYITGVLAYVENLYADSADYADKSSLIRNRAEAFASIILQDTQSSWTFAGQTYIRHEVNTRSYLARVYDTGPDVLINFYHTPPTTARPANTHDCKALLLDLQEGCARGEISLEQK